MSIRMVGRLRPPIDDQATGAPSAVANLRRGAGFSRAAREQALAAHAIASERQRLAQARFNQGILGAEGLRQEKAAAREELTKKLEQLAEVQTSRSQVAEQARVTHWGFDAVALRTPLPGAEGFAGKADLLALVQAMDEHQALAFAQRAVDSGDVGALGVVVLAHPDLRADVIDATRNLAPLQEARVAEAAAFSTMRDGAAIFELLDQVRGSAAGQVDPVDSLKLATAESAALGPIGTSIPAADIESAADFHLTARADFMEARAELDRIAAAGRVTAEPTGAARLAAAMEGE